MTASASSAPSAVTRDLEPLRRVLRRLVQALAVLAGVGVLFMMTITCLDVVLRLAGHSLRGAVDLISLAGAVTLAASLPCTTAAHGHVAIEFFIRKLRPRAHAALSAAVTVASMALFAFISRQSAAYGYRLWSRHELTPTLQIPVYWVLYVLTACSALVIAVLAWQLVRPRQRLLAP